MNEFKLFHNRSDAGKRLANKLDHYKNDANSVVLAIPRGGVPVGYEVAKKLHLPFDIFIVRKLGAPLQKELAMGAIASGDVIFFNEEVINGFGVSENEINGIIAEEKSELQRREKKYRQGHPFVNISGKNVILVDDGIATGASIHTAIIALKKLKPKKIIIAIPVAPKQTVSALSKLVDEMICLNAASIFYAVGQFYEDFSQTSDEEVNTLLSDTWRKNHD